MQDLHEAAVLYLDKTKQFEHLRKRSELYKTKSQSVYFYTVSINSVDLVEFNANLGNMVLNQPQLATKIFQEIVYIAVKSLSLVDGDPLCSQVSVSLKLTFIPSLSSYILKPSQMWKCNFESRFFQFEGVICSMTTRTQYTKCAKFKCSVANCIGALDNSHIRFHAAGVRESQTIRKDFSCMYCAAKLIEDVHHRILGDKLVVQMVHSSALCSSNEVSNKSATRFQSIVAFFRDDLIDKIHIGGSYKVIGIPVKEIKGVITEVFVEVNNIIPKTIQEQTIPLKIQQLLTDNQHSPWGFVSRLVDSFAVYICPSGTYHSLKLAILFSLIQTKEDAPKLNILAVGSSTHIMSRLLTFGAKLVDRSIITSPSSEDIFSSVSSETYGTGVCSVDAGSLALADDGVCIVGEVSTFKRHTLERLTTTLEKNTESVGIPRRYVETSNVEELNIPLRCSVWGTFYTSKTNYNQHLFAHEKTKKTSELGQVFQLGFNIVCVCDGLESARDDLVNAKLASSVLSSAMLPDDVEFDVTNNSVCVEDLKQFISFARNREVTLSKSAEMLIRGYFVGSRRVRSGSVHATPMPQSALQTLLCLAHAHAKLSLRPEVLMEDATVAVLMYEETMTIRHGCSVLSVKPTMCENTLTPQDDSNVYQLQTQLIRFCQIHAAEVFTVISEE
ncbi:minichromosome maintenance domain-containing protein 2-like [Antedon mediterranea]|uniref:minichromosome maintenance domain-containing protein 2-like n=1 Tax=Antedon mediterranea TaxID=105859 RepID=UPI003AF40BD4